MSMYQESIIWSLVICSLVPPSVLQGKGVGGHPVVKKITTIIMMSYTKMAYIFTLVRLCSVEIFAFYHFPIYMSTTLFQYSTVLKLSHQHLL